MGGASLSMKRIVGSATLHAMKYRYIRTEKIWIRLANIPRNTYNDEGNDDQHITQDDEEVHQEIPAPPTMEAPYQIAQPYPPDYMSKPCYGLGPLTYMPPVIVFVILRDIYFHLGSRRKIDHHVQLIKPLPSRVDRSI
ncbi:hypothetical protein Syun_017261 [Stephania yunnanensis]|uniref:Uncharacterized protein n=1 Tax=Stephania yunnanensis TaxID=152371 RepID=A0AAP0J6R3_9MAGN